MGFLGYCAIMWLCFPPWPYMQQGVEGNQEPIPILSCCCWYVQPWLPSTLPAFCLCLPLGNKVRELFGNEKNKSSSGGLSRRRGQDRGCLCLPVAQGVGSAVGSPWQGLPRLQASRHSFGGALSRAICCLQSRFKKLKEYVQVSNCC